MVRTLSGEGEKLRDRSRSSPVAAAGSAGRAPSGSLPRATVTSRSEDELNAVVAEARELGGDGLALVVDCMDAALDHDDELFEQNLFLNLTSAHYASRGALPHKIEGGYGRVVSIDSGYATHGGAMVAHNAAARWRRPRRDHRPSGSVDGGYKV